MAYAYVHHNGDYHKFVQNWNELLEVSLRNGHEVTWQGIIPGEGELPDMQVFSYEPCSNSCILSFMFGEDIIPVTDFPKA